jgi:hypothetical protein
MPESPVIPAVETAMTDRGWRLKERRLRKLGQEPIGVTLTFEKAQQKLTVTILSKQDVEDE